MIGRNDGHSESDVAGDPHVAESRAGHDDGEGEGSYVGRTGSDDDIDAGETGAEARAQAR